LQWRPVRLGAGGFITGFVSHPKDAGVRYCRTDVGNAYRWDGKEWQPMLVIGKGSGIPESCAPCPGGQGVESIAVDPADTRIVYMVATSTHSADLATSYPQPVTTLFRSTDGGRTFSAYPLPVKTDSNGPWRTLGERLKVDPANGQVLYYGSLDAGLWRSQDAGAHWEPVSGPGAPARTANVLAVHFSTAEGAITLHDRPVSRALYAVEAKGAVRWSQDGGQNWEELSQGLPVHGNALFSTIDANGTLHVLGDKLLEMTSCKGHDVVRQRIDIDWDWPAQSVAFDPKNPNRVYAMTAGGSYSRSLDGGRTWFRLADKIEFANRFGWLPQAAGWRSNAGLTIDANGTLWTAEGNEGMLRLNATDKEGRGEPRWTIDSRGIEEFVTHDVVQLPGGDALFVVMDATMLISSDPNQFVARQVSLQKQFINEGTGVAYCPNDPMTIALAAGPASGYSLDGGRTWNPFQGAPKDTKTGSAANTYGSIAISARGKGKWTKGSDHLVWLPVGDGPPYFSLDGGRTWSPGSGFPLKNGYWISVLKQKLLAADPFTPDRYYLVGTWAGGFYVSSDGGKTWAPQSQAGIPSRCHHGQLAVNRLVRNDLWLCDGYEGASEHGLWHSADGGAHFTRIAGIEHAITLALGVGPGEGKGASYAVYFYGKMKADPKWGIFQSTTGGKSWRRASGYPLGIFDTPTCLSASWDKFERLIVGFSGNSYAIGTR
jgi:photosystem II stability/assembly factor-like uncharacterized protein